jgi:hypothetical protein
MTDFNNQLLQFASSGSQPTSSPPNDGVQDQSPMQLDKSPAKSQQQLKSKLLE